MVETGADRHEGAVVGRRFSAGDGYACRNAVAQEATMIAGYGAVVPQRAYPCAAGGNRSEAFGCREVKRFRAAKHVWSTPADERSVVPEATRVVASRSLRSAGC